MPELDSPLHLDMFRGSPTRGSRFGRAIRAFGREIRRKPLYGLEWGDPEDLPPLRWVRDRWLLPYVRSGHTAIEIGPGGGRWTRYMLGFDRVYAVDFHAEILDELRKNLPDPKVMCVRNNGTDFPGIPPVDFVFSFGTFVHLDPALIEGYLLHMGAILKPTGNVVIQYADKTKPMGRDNTGFSEMTPERMRSIVTASGFEIREEDAATLWHSSLIRFGRPD